MARNPEPQAPESIGPYHVRYAGRDYYDTPQASSGSLRADVAYLTDWKAWAERQLTGYRAWEASVTEALNSGDGAYRP